MRGIMVLRAKLVQTIAAFGLALGLLGGCQDYSFSVNEKTLYEPPRLFSDFSIDDATLRACVEQAIRDGRVTAADQLRELNCSSAGIRSLAGLESFSGLRQLGFDRNLIEDLSPLYALKTLELLQVRENRLRMLSSQLCTTGLKRIAVAGNANLDCKALDELEGCGIQILDAPEHCPP